MLKMFKMRIMAMRMVLMMFNMIKMFKRRGIHNIYTIDDIDSKVKDEKRRKGPDKKIGQICCHNKKPMCSHAVNKLLKALPARKRL